MSVGTPITYFILQGIISGKSIHQTAALRAAGVKFVIVSGARNSTVLQRLPFLPAADAYISENGRVLLLMLVLDRAPWNRHCCLGCRRPYLLPRLRAAHWCEKSWSSTLSHLHPGTLYCMQLSRLCMSEDGTRTRAATTSECNPSQKAPAPARISARCCSSGPSVMTLT
jgi:hypothetical protein